MFPADSKSGHIADPRFALRQVAKETGIKATVHDLRRTYITVAEICDISTYKIKRLVNHSVRNDVTANYIKLTVEDLRKAQQKVTDKLKADIGIEGPASNVERLG